MVTSPPPDDPSVPPPLPAHRDPADAWVFADSGERYWGLYGAAGLLAHDPARGVLLQHRAAWSHFGGTWGIPGGARHLGESALEGALREAEEEAAVPRNALVPVAEHTLDLEIWTYTTVVARVDTPFEPEVADAESLSLAWVGIDAVTDLPLHPGLADAWPVLRTLLEARPALLVDTANVVGSVPDGWWRDRAGSTTALLAAVADAIASGLPGDPWGIEGGRVMPHVVAVLEGDARSAESALPVRAVKAERDGDSEIVAQASALASEGFAVTVVTSDRGLRARLPEGVRTVGPSWLRELLPG
ncbi:NUDIX domain-containing protein [Demequina zhanjiangensis]|uniref:NUDIX domain-containing protein n=1 Tax=Demequina zhanjiangensis TaxID=3051659 RepID=A0ABT8G2B2_9MICO|nr:NUDIX domain-containing protein [Demequina sp. SYSU T00b26]MDN4473275.1 NUDIX domain-containing protein [Demequina sp. SYSU T00b26]